MKGYKILIVLGLVFLGVTLAYAAPVPPPKYALQISCYSPTGSVVQDGSIFVPAGTEITLSSNLQGEWIGYGNSTTLTTTINQDTDFTFRANDSFNQQATVHARVNSEKHCLPEFESDKMMDDDKNVFVPGEDFKIRAEYTDTDCPFDFHWVIDNNDGALQIDDPYSRETTVHVERRTASGIDPVIRGILSNGIDWPLEIRKTVIIENAVPPVLELSVEANVFDHQSDIVVSREGSYAPGGGCIKKFYATLYRFDGTYWPQVGEPQYTEGKTITFSVGQGEYEVVAYVKDEHGQPSANETKYVSVAANKDDIPQVSVPSRIVNCTTNDLCDFHADVSGRNAAIGFFDEEGGRFNCSGPDCQTIYPDPGPEEVIVWGYHFNDSDYYRPDHHSEATISINVTSKNIKSPPANNANTETNPLTRILNWLRV